MVTFFNTYPSPSLLDIRKLEEFTGLLFPREFVNHILKYNGGKCSPAVFDFIENGEQTSSEIRYFLSVSEDTHSIKHSIRVYNEQKRIPSYMLPIAEDDFGNLVCISCANTTYGQIYFWNHEEEEQYTESIDTIPSCFYFIASNFNAFIDLLREYTDNE